MSKPRRSCGATACCLAVVLGSGLAVAEDSAPKVVIAGDASHELAVEVIFTGYARRTDKGVSIFVRMTREVPVETERTGRTLTYRLPGAKLGVRNNANPLPTEHFGPPVSNVALIASSTGVDLVIELSASSEGAPPTHRFVSGGGLRTLLVELPPAAR